MYVDINDYFKNLGLMSSPINVHVGLYYFPLRVDVDEADIKQ